MAKGSMSRSVHLQVSVNRDVLAIIRTFAQEEYGWLEDAGRSEKYITDTAFMSLVRAGLREKGRTCAELPRLMAHRHGPRILSFPGTD